MGQGGGEKSLYQAGSLKRQSHGTLLRAETGFVIQTKFV